MKRRFEKRIAVALIISMVLTQPLTLMAAESGVVSDNHSMPVTEQSESETGNVIASENEAEVPVVSGNGQYEITIPENNSGEVSSDLVTVSEDSKTTDEDEAEPATGIGNGNVAKICLNDTRSMAIDTDGNLWEWGEYSNNGRYGSGTEPHRYDYAKNDNALEVGMGLYHDGYPVTRESTAYIDSTGKIRDANVDSGILKENINKLSLAEDNNYYYGGAIDKDGKLWVWSYEQDEESNDPSYSRPNHTKPINLLPGTLFKEICFGETHFAAIDTEGNLWTWGNNIYGQLGNDTPSNALDFFEPSKVVADPADTKFEKVSLGDYQTAAIDTEGNLWTWGSNYGGVLGDGTNIGRSTPKKVEISGASFKEVSLGGIFGAAIDTEGNLWTWGTNSSGELGNGSAQDSTIHTPEKIMQGTSFKEVSLGSSHGAAIDINEDLWIWGSNYAGQIGDGTTENCYTPKIITIPDNSLTPKCTVSFNSMGGSAVASQKVASGSYASKPADPTRKGYRFAGWYKDQDCKQAWDFNKDEVKTDPTILYAKWTKGKYPGNPVKGADATTWDCIWFGRYFQSEKKTWMDKDPIKWRVLNFDENTGEALLLSDMNLDNRQWTFGEYNIPKNWKDSDLKKWLNSNTDGFKRDAFTYLEQAAILNSEIDGDECKVFLLSFEDVTNEKYGFESWSVSGNNDNGEYDNKGGYRAVLNTEFCNEGGYDKEKDWNISANWYTRDRQYIVQTNGDIFKWKKEKIKYNVKYYVRPAIRLNLYSDSEIWEYAGTVLQNNNPYKERNESDNKPESRGTSTDRWLFNNVSSSDWKNYGGFFAGSRKDYYIEEQDYKKFIGSISENERNKFANLFLESASGNDVVTYSNYLKLKHKDWFGSCYGMSLTKGLYDAGIYAPPQKFNIAENVDDPVESRINYYAFMQARDIEYSSRVNCGGYTGNSFIKLKNKAMNIKNADDYFLISIGWNVSKNGLPFRNGHSILCTGGEECYIPEGKIYTYRLKIYDPNDSIYGDDYSYIYISSDNRTAYIPGEGFLCSSYSLYGSQVTYDIINNNTDLYYNEASLKELSDPLANDKKETSAPAPRIYSEMTEMNITEIDNESGNEKWSYKFVNGALESFKNILEAITSGIKAIFSTPSGFVKESDNLFRGGFYELVGADSKGNFSIKGGENDKLNAEFEYGGHTVGIIADTTGGSAVFSNNGNVKVNGLNGCDFTIRNIYNVDYPEKPGNATEVCISAKGTGDYLFKQSKEAGYELTPSGGGTSLANTSIVIGTTLANETHKLNDSKGKITVSFDSGQVIVREDTDGDGTLDEEEVFPDYNPVTNISIAQSAVTVGVGETKELTASIEPASASDKNLYWFSNNENVVRVVDGKITGVAKGTAVVTAKAGVEKKSSSCTVTVGGSDNPDDDDIPKNAPKEGIWIKGLKASYPYTGSAIKPEFKVYNGRTMLYQKTDYTLRYSGNKKPGTATVTLKMKGNYSGSKDVNFRIDPASLKTDVSADVVYVAYKKNKTQKPKPEMYVNGVKLKYGKNDLVFTYPSTSSGGKKAYVDPGTYQIHIESKNAQLFTDSKDVDLMIVDKPLMSEVSTPTESRKLGYNDGKPVSANFNLYYYGAPLMEGRDYTVRYEDDFIDIGKHKVTFIGNNRDYFGKKTITYSITGKYIMSSKNTRYFWDSSEINPDGTFPFKNGGVKPALVISYNGTKLVAGKDYSVSYKNYNSLGKATINIRGKGKYSSNVFVNYNIVKRDINTISPDIADRPYSSKAGDYKKTKITFLDGDHKNQKLKADRDYTIKFAGDYGTAPAPGTEIKVIIQGEGNFSGTINTSYRIIDKNYDFTKAKVVVNGGKAYDYTGSAIRPAAADLIVTIGGSPLSTENYEILGYYNNIKKGNSAYIRLRGKGNYAGVKTVKFKIGAAPAEKVWTGVILKLHKAFAFAW